MLGNKTWKSNQVVFSLNLFQDLQVGKEKSKPSMSSTVQYTAGQNCTRLRLASGFIMTYAYHKEKH